MSVSKILDLCAENEISLQVVGDNLKVVSKGGKLNNELRLLLKENKPDLIELLKSASNDASDRIPAIYKSDHGQQEFALSHAQRRMWFAYKMDPNSSVHNISASYAINGELDVAALCAAFEELVERHTALRTEFVELEGNQVAQRIRQNYEFSVNVIDLCHLDEEQSTATTRELAKADSEKPFDLGEDILIRVNLLKLGEQRHVLLVTQHHIVSDGWSVSVLMGDLAQLYQAKLTGNHTVLPELPIQFVDYTSWHRERMLNVVNESKMEFWRDLLGGAPEVHSLPLDKPRAKKHDPSGKLYSTPLDKSLVEKLNRFSLEKGVSNYMLFYAVYAALISRMSGSQDVVIGSPISNRTQIETENMVGLFTNTIALRANLDEVSTPSELLNQCKYKILSAQQHQDVPFELVIEDLNPSRSLSHHPIFQLVLNYYIRKPESNEGELNIEPLELEQTQVNFDLIMRVQEYPEKIIVDWEYAKTLFDDHTVENMADCFIQLLSEFIENPDVPLQELSLLSPSVEDQLIQDARSQLGISESKANFNELFEKTVQTHGSKRAVVCGDAVISYSELDKRSNQLAHWIAAQGAKPGDLICVSVERSIEMITALLGILKAGCGYLPVDARNPKSRLEHIVTDAGANIAIGCHGDDIANLVANFIEFQDLKFGKEGVLENYSSNQPSLSDDVLNGDSLAYAIYTSGSTGKPKGVRLSHKGLVNLAIATSNQFGISHETRMLQFASFTFDAATWDFAMAMASGAELHMVPETTIANPSAVGRYVQQNLISYCFFTPSLLNSLDVNEFNSVATIAVGGEAISLNLAKTWSVGRKLFNAYGPTENTVVATCQRLTEDMERVTIGTPINNVAGLIMDGDGRLVPNGVMGELCLAGVGVAQGYINRADLTAEKFINGPLAEKLGSRIYRTGDLVRRLSNGELEFFGRADDQVKVRGYRIELGEIESQLSLAENINECVAIANKSSEGHDRIIAYVTLSDDQHDKDMIVNELREFAMGNLPEYMVPAAFVVMDKIPLSASGKVDKKALPDADISAVAKEGYIAPRNALEEKLCRCWESVLGVSPIGIRDNFFALGGDSILCLQLVSKAKEAGVVFAVEDIFEYQSIEALAKIQSRHQEPAEQHELTGEMPLMPVQSYFFEGNIEHHFFNQSVNLLPPEEFNESCLRTSIAELLARHDALRLCYPKKNGEVVGHFTALTEQLLDEVVHTIEIESDDAAEQNSIVKATCAEFQETMDITRGSLVRALYFTTPQVCDRRLIIIVHHLVVDAVSWRIILDDLTNCFRQWRDSGTAKLPEKTNSFRQWREALENYMLDADLAGSKAFWKSQAESQTSTLKTDKDCSPTTYETSSQMLRKLDRSQTRSLLEMAGKNNSSQINNLLLSALAGACGRWQGMESVTVMMESFGRDTSIKRMDLSQTVGWFTATYPIKLPVVRAVDESRRLDAQLETVNTILDKVSGRILDYGILKYIAKDPEFIKTDHDLKADLIFNYLGQGDQIKNDQVFEVHTEDYGPSSSVKRYREYPIAFKSLVAGGELCAVVEYSCTEFEENTISNLLDAFISELELLISQREKLDAMTGIGEMELQAYGDEVRKPASHFQQMMLEGLSQGAVDTTLIIPFNWRIRGDLDKKALTKALQAIFSRQNALSAGFVEDGGIYYFEQAKTPELSVAELDISGEDAEQKLQQTITNDAEAGFDLRSGPLMKAKILTLGDGDHALVGYFHHVVFDGWSLKLVKQELSNLYRSFAAGKKNDIEALPIQLSDYGYWQRNILQTATNRRRLDELRSRLNLSGVHSKITCDGERGPSVSRELQTITANFPTDLNNKLSAFTAQEGVTNYSVFVAAYRLALFLYGGDEHLLLSSPQADRDRSELQNVVGAFLNWMVINIPVSKNQNLFEYFLNAKEVISDAYRNRDLNIFAATEGMSERTTIHDVISSVQFQYLDGLNNSDDKLLLDGLDVNAIRDCDKAVENHNDLCAIVLKHQDCYRCELSFNKALFKRESAENILANTLKIVSMLVDSDDRKIHKL